MREIKPQNNTNCQTSAYIVRPSLSFSLCLSLSLSISLSHFLSLALTLYLCISLYLSLVSQIYLESLTTSEYSDSYTYIKSLKPKFPNTKFPNLVLITLSIFFYTYNRQTFEINGSSKKSFLGGFTTPPPTDFTSSLPLLQLNALAARTQPT